MKNTFHLHLIKIDNLVPIFIILVNYWIWKILFFNVMIGLLVLFTSLILYMLCKEQKIRLSYAAVILFLFSVLSLLIVRLGYDDNLSKIGIDEGKQLNDRHVYLSKDLGQIFLNKYSLNFYKNYNPFIYKLQSNFFDGLDINLYFFAGHPRERAGISEFEKFPSIYIIFFIIGILTIFRLNSFLIYSYLLAAALVNSFISKSFIVGPVLLFPLIVTITSFGVVSVLKLIFKKCSCLTLK